MKSCLRALLSESIDYAGTFPPARLSLGHALENFARYQSHPEGWMLARIVCRSDQLAELDASATVLTSTAPHRARGGPLLDLIAEQLGVDRDKLPSSGSLEDLGADSLDAVEFAMELEEELGQEISADDIGNILRRGGAHLLSVVIPAVDSAEETLDKLSITSKAAAHLELKHRERLKVDAIELRLPADVSQRPRKFAMTDFIDVAMRRTSSPDLSVNKLFLEVPLTDRWQHNIDSAVEGIGARNDSKRFGLKIRTGGLDRADFPSVEQLAYFIAACRDSRLCWKATAGLHGPLYHFDGKTGTWQYGFVNVLCAAVFATIHKLDQAQIEELLVQESLKEFLFEDGAIAWRDLRTATEELRQARGESIISFGSCSFEEPLDGLRELHLI